MGDTPLQRLADLGQRVWLDELRRSYLRADGLLPRLVADGDVVGVTTNPTIFEVALREDREAYAEQLDALRGSDAEQALWELMVDDVRAACDVLLPLWRDGGDGRGLVSIELDPGLADRTEETVAEGLALAGRVDRPNVMVKVPGTEAGVRAVPRLVAEGVSVNVTLLFSVDRYVEAARAHRDGLRRRLEAGEDVADVSGVASFFVSRVDGAVDAELAADHPLRGTAAVANARRAHAAFEALRAEPEAVELVEAGAREQLPLWASTSAKDPALPPAVYVEQLAGPDTVTTLPLATLDAVREGCEVADRLTGAGEAADRVVADLAADGVDLARVAADLEADGIRRFADSFDGARAAVAEAVADERSA